MIIQEFYWDTEKILTICMKKWKTQLKIEL